MRKKYVTGSRGEAVYEVQTRTSLHPETSTAILRTQIPAQIFQ